MSLLESISEAVQKVLPQRKDSAPIPLSSSGGIGNGGGFHTHKEDLILTKTAIVFHALQIFFVFIAMCCFASLSAFQAQWGVGPSGLNAFAIFIAVFAMFDSAFLLAIPVLYDKYDKAVRLARALRETRVQFILTGFGVVTVPLIAFITTISVGIQPGCKDPTTDPNAQLGKDFQNGLGDWCRTKRAGVVFFWFAAVCYIASFVYAFLDWRHGRSTYNTTQPRDPPFTHPEDAPMEEDEEAYPRRTPQRISTLPPQLPDEVGSPFGDERAVAMPRPSMDAYGAFNDPAPTGYGEGGAVSPGGARSRTMQFAEYADPYAAVRGRLAQGTGSPVPVGGPPPPQYDYGGGYR